MYVHYNTESKHARTWTIRAPLKPGANSDDPGRVCNSGTNLLHPSYEAATLFQGNHDRNHKLRYKISTERYSICRCCWNVICKIYNKDMYIKHTAIYHLETICAGPTDNICSQQSSREYKNYMAGISIFQVIKTTLISNDLKTSMGS